MEIKDKKIIIVASIIVVLVVILGYNNILNPLFEAKPLAITEPINEFGSKTDVVSPYQCPSDVSLCKVQGVMNCTIPKGEPKVIFRTNAMIQPVKRCLDDTDCGSSQDCINDQCWYDIRSYYLHFSKKWIAVDTNNDGYLESFYYSTRSIVECSINDILATSSNDFLFGVTHVCKYGNYVMVQLPSSSSNYNIVFKRLENVGAELDPNQKEPYISNNQEITEGNVDMYTCNANFIITETKEGSVVSRTEPMAYSSKKPGQKLTPQFDLQPKGIAEIIGNDIVRIRYGTYKTYEECPTGLNSCNNYNTGYYMCNNGKIDYSKLIPCDVGAGEICDSGGCIPPFITKLQLADSNGNVKSGFTKDEQIKALVTVISQRPSIIPSGYVVLNVYMGGEIIKTYESSAFNFDGGEIRMDINNPVDSSEYLITMDVKYDSKTIKNVASYIFNVGSGVLLQIQTPYTDLTGTSLYTNSPIHIKLITNAINVNPIILAVKLDGVLQTNPNFVTPQEEGGIYDFIYNFPKAGHMVVDATVEKQGIKSNSVHVEVEVKDPKITTTLTNIAMLRAIKPSTQTIKFETKGSYGSYVDTTNEVRIIPPGASTGMGDEDVSSTVIPVDTGKYEFTYNFNTIGGYGISIKSTAEGYPIGDKPAVGGITVGEDVIPDECAASEDCPAGKICVDGKCDEKEPPIVLYLIIIGSVVLLIVLVIIIINLSRRRSSPTLGGF